MQIRSKRGQRTVPLVALALMAAVVVVDSIEPDGAAAVVTDCDGVMWEGPDATTGQIWTANADGSERTNLTSPVGTTGNSWASWSNDATRIAWSGSAGGVRSIWIMNEDGSSPIAISEVGEGVDPIGNSRQAWSPDDTRIAWQGWDGTTTQLYVADVDGAHRVEISTVGPDPDPIDNFDPVWSPDGDEIAWSGADLIYVAGVDGTNRRVISDVGPDAPTHNVKPRWSPDGTKILWNGSDGVSHQIWVANADGSDRLLLSTVSPDPDPGNNFNPQWSPDGTRVVWEGSGSIWIANADGTDRQEISGLGPDTAPTANRMAAWSPDGTRISWSGTLDSTDQVFVADADGTNRTSVSDADDGVDPLANYVPRWRPRTGDITISTSSDQMVVGSPATLTVSVAAECGHSGVSIAGVTAPGCLSDPNIVVSTGSVAGETWSIGDLDGTATATISGTVVTAGPCLGTATLGEAYPVHPSEVSAGFGEWATVPCPSGPHGFVDVAATSFADGDIGCIKALGITTGTGTDTYSPAQTVTREQMAAFLARMWRAMGGECSADPHGFVDVAATSFADSDIGCIKALGITTGTGTDTYSPAQTVTREQMAAFLGRLIRATAN